MVSVDDYVRAFKKELENGKNLDELLFSIAERMVVRDKQIRDEKQAVILQRECLKILEEKEHLHV
jgi:hypothetical protein